MLISVTCVALGLPLTLPCAAAAAELAVIGALRTSAGGPVADGGYGIIARLYDGQASKTPIYKAVFGKVQVKTGQSSIATAPIP